MRPGYSLTGGRASESWSVKVEIANIMETYIVFWDNDTIVADDQLYDVATGDHRSVPWKGAVVIVNDLALSCESGSCSAWRKDGSRAWSVDATEEANVSEGVIVRSGKHYVVAVGEADRDRAYPLTVWAGAIPSLDELTAWNTGDDDGIPEDKRVGEYTTKEVSCISRVSLDDGPSFAAPEVHVYEIRSYNTGLDEDCSSLHAAATNGSGIVTFSGVGSHPQNTTFYAMVDAKSGTTIDVPGLDPSEGDYLVFADPRTAVGYSPRNGALTTYTPAG